jgi:hypothetical protein
MMIIARWTSLGYLREDCGVADRQLRRRCEAIIAAVDIPDPFHIHEFCRLLGERRGRPIHLIPMRLPEDQPCGLWVSTSQFDAIFFEAETSPLHQEHIIGHEIGHLLCQHEAAPVLDPEASRLLLPDLDPDLVQRTLGRTSYSTVEEREAEMIASLLSREANRPGPTHTWVAPPEVADVFARLEHSLEHPSDRSDGPGTDHGGTRG